MKNTRFFSGLLILVFGGTLCAGLQLSSNGKTPYVIVKSADATEAESFAASELSCYLKQVTGAEFKIVEDKMPEPLPAIHVGNTFLARKNEIDTAKLAPEEWIIRQVGKDILLGGGRPRGVLYGVYDFLERYARCRWYDLCTEKAPAQPNLTLPDMVNVRKKPFIRYRDFYWVNGIRPEYTLWAVRNRINGQIWSEAKYGFCESCGSPGFVHTYYQYSKDFPKECFSMNQEGKREKPRDATGPGQLCFTQPLTLKLCIENLRSYIDMDRKKALERKRPFPRIYEFSSLDNSDECHCPDCLAAKEKFGGYSGLVIHFANQLADSIAKDYPEVVVRINAYRAAMEPPKKPINAHENVMVRVTSLGVEFAGDRGRDVLRPLTAKQNQLYLQQLNGWKEVSRIGVWDYFRMFGQPFGAPVSSIGTRAELFRKYYDLGVESIFIEGEIYPGMTDHFLDLRNWLTGKLMADPVADVPALTDDFMNSVYGKAAPVMKEYLAYVEERMKEEKDNLSTKYPSKWAYLDNAFYRHAKALMDQAESRVKNDPQALSHVQQERFLVDSSMLNMYDSYPENPLGLSKKELTDRVILGEQSFWEKYHGKSYWAANSRKHTETYIAMLNRPPLPKEFQGKTVASHLCWSDISTLQKAVINDKDAAGGKALVIPVFNGLDPNTFHDSGFQYGVCAPTHNPKQLISKTIPEKDLPQDEKYHTHYLCRTTIPDSQTFLWLHWSWHLQPKLGHLYDPAEIETMFDIYASLKFEGPAYVKGSRKENNIFIDRVIVLRAAKH
jgi:hypothetical protein